MINEKCFSVERKIVDIHLGHRELNVQVNGRETWELLQQFERKLFPCFKLRTQSAKSLTSTTTLRLFFIRKWLFELFTLKEKNLFSMVPILCMNSSGPVINTLNERIFTFPLFRIFPYKVWWRIVTIYIARVGFEKENFPRTENVLIILFYCVWRS